MIDEDLHIVEDTTEAPYEGKWRNLLFSSKGKSRLGGGLHDSAVDAIASYNRIKNLPPIWRGGKMMVPFFRLKGGGGVQARHITHSIPIPVKD